MDDSLTQAFVSECEESIVELNNALLALESNPADREAMDSIFRMAHTLKGNFGAMGYDDGQTVAHAVEDLLDAVRQDRIEITAERMDVVFDGVDALDAIVEQIRETGASDTAVDDVVDRVRAAAEPTADAAESPGAAAEPTADAAGSPGAARPEVGRSAGDADPVERGSAGLEASASNGHALDAAAAAEGTVAEGTVAEGTVAEGTAAEGTAVDGSVAEGSVAVGRETPFDPSTIETDEPLVAVHITLREGGMKSVDATLVVRAIPDGLTVHDARPSLEEIATGEFDDGFDLCLAGATAEAVETAFADVWGVGTATAVPLSSPVSRPPAGGDGDATAGASLAGHEIRSVRIDVGELDELHELVEQLVTSRIKLRRVIEEANVRRATDMMDEVDKVSGNLQNTVMDMRLIPVKKVFGKFPRLMRDLARAQDKEITFVVEGQEIELDRTILDQVSDPLMHVLRNAADHGVEPPAEREAAGKPREGTISLTATREHDHVVIEVADDGRGLDADRLREKAVETGAISRLEADAMPDDEAYNLVFHPGLSTADEVTDISGRGVGMDVAVTTIRRLDGSIDVDSAPGEGTTVSVRLPVTVAIIKILLVQVGSREYGVPISSIDEIARATDLDTINGKDVLVHDERIYPLVRLHEVLDVAEEPVGDGMVVRIRPEERACALHCDRVNQQEEVVVKPFSGPLHGVRGFSGAAVIGDGDIIPILDVATLGVGPDGEVLA